MKKKKNILMIGPYTTVGGVSIHIKRLALLLQADFNFLFVDESPISSNDFSVYNIRSMNAIKYLKLVGSADVIHIHSGVGLLRCFHILIAFVFRKKIIVTLHSAHNFSNGLIRGVNRWFLNLSDTIVCVSKEIKALLKIAKSQVIPAFVPPVLEQEESLPKSLLQLLQRSVGKKIIVSNAFRLDMNNGEDLYGLDLLLAVAKRLKQKETNAVIVFVVADINDSTGLYQKYVTQIEEEKLNDYISIFPKAISFVTLMQKSDVVVRATNTDGDALTVREALYLKKPIIASDATWRPLGSILFKNRDANDLYLKLAEATQKDQAYLKDQYANLDYKGIYKSIYTF